jgi:hypothetical protein
MKISEQFKALENSKVAVILNHKLFGAQKFNVDALHIIDDDERSGITLKNQEIFIYKKDLQFFNLHNNTYILADKRLKIIVNKL